MDENYYEKALEMANAEMAELTTKKAEIEKRIAKLRQTIASLSAMHEESDEEDIKLYIPSPMERAQRDAAIGMARLMVGKTIGLTDAVREVLKAADKWLYPTEVRDGLERMGIDTQSYSNILASIHTILKRLADKGEVEEFKTPDGKGVSYRWRKTPTLTRRDSLPTSQSNKGTEKSPTDTLERPVLRRGSTTVLERIKQHQEKEKKK